MVEMGGTRRAAAMIVASLAIATGASCSSLAPPKTTTGVAPRSLRIAAMVDGSPIDLYISRPLDPVPGTPLVIFASGDGGWFGAAVGMFETIAAAGYPVIGISSRALLHIERKSGRTVSAERIAAAYRQIIEEGRRALMIEGHGRVILSGWSRGASMAVMLGAHHPEASLAGVVAIGLAGAEDLDVDLDSDEDIDAVTGTVGPVDTYRLARSLSVRCAIIQSTGDGYLPAGQARILFGEDTVRRRFYEVPSSNHRFSGGESAFRQSLRDAVAWVSADEQLQP